MSKNVGNTHIPKVQHNVETANYMFMDDNFVNLSQIALNVVDRIFTWVRSIDVIANNKKLLKCVNCGKNHSPNFSQCPEDFNISKIKTKY